MITLDTLRPGQSGIIERLQGGGSVLQRLLEMGLTEGETITVLAMAPLGDPLEILVRGYQLSLRKREAQFVVLQPQ